MENLQQTLRLYILPAAIVATKRLAAMLTTMLLLELFATSLSPVRGGRLIIFHLVTMENLQQTLRLYILPAAIAATERLAAMLTTMLLLVLLATSLTEPTATANFRRDEDSVSSFEEPSGGNECCICLEHHITDDVASISGCEHKFCTECITSWAGIRNVCPICRTAFTSIVSADGAIQLVPDRRSAAADLEVVILARPLFMLSREEVEFLSELSDAHEAYWSVVAAARAS